MKMTFSTAGDMLVQRRVSSESEGFSDIKNHIEKAEVRFVNLETTLHNGEYPANQYSGGSYLRADPKTLDDVKAYGFNMVSFTNNHTMDFGHGGLLATKKYVDEAGLVNTGAGKNLDEASSPAYLDTKSGRTALISVVSTINNNAAIAGRQSRRYEGRPGVNALRVASHLQVTEEQFKTIQEIGRVSKINAQRDIERAEGYFTPLADGVEALGSLEFKLGSETKYVTHPHPEDMARVEKAIYEAEMMSDCIIVSVHSHEIAGDKKENPADFLIEFAHRCIDAGAHAVIGHGPHLIRPIEIYKGKPIFYSLGDFMIHNECIPFAPEEMYAEKGMTSDATMREFFCNRSKNYTRGLMRDHRMLEAVIPYFEIEDGELTYLELMPIELNFEKKVWQAGNPRFSNKHGIIERLAEMSAPYGTEISIDKRGFGIIKI